MKNGFEPSNIYSFSRRIRIRIQNWTKTTPRPDFDRFLKNYDFYKNHFFILISEKYRRPWSVGRYEIYKTAHIQARTPYAGYVLFYSHTFPVGGLSSVAIT